MKYTNIHCYCRWFSVLYVSVNETMACLQDWMEAHQPQKENDLSISLMTQKTRQLGSSFFPQGTDVSLFFLIFPGEHVVIQFLLLCVLKIFLERVAWE